MKVRFGERFALQIDAPPGTDSLLVPRMLLQPIVENSILHGFGGIGGRGRAGRGTIRVAARREVRAVPPPACAEPGVAALGGEVLILEVRDDGAGIAPGAAVIDGKRNGQAADRRSPESLHRIGIHNVERRIALNFGAPYGMAMESEPGAFTEVRFVLPALVRGEATDADGACDA
jgi:two-component system sensor histidine kinase YesM